MTEVPARILRAVIDDEGGDESEADLTSQRIADAALQQFELFGMARSTVEEIARRAHVARVTVYRRFPGKDAIVDAVALRELRRFLGQLDDHIGELDDVEDMIVEGFVFTLHAVRSHRLLQRLLESEPELLLPHLTVDGAPFIGLARDYMLAKANEIGDERDRVELATTAEIVVRLLLSYVLTPQASIDLDDPAVARDFARRYLGPLILGPGA